MHGAGGGHGSGRANPAYRHGLRGQEWMGTRIEISDLVRAAREAESMIE